MRNLVALYRLTVPASNLQPRRIAPTTTIDIIIQHRRRITLVFQIRQGTQPRAAE
jgi:hypothetical protein